MPITININSGADFEPVSEGVHAAVLADIKDLGVVETAFGPKEKVQFIWLTDEADETGRTKYLFKRYTKSLHEKASLRKDVKAILGKDIEGASFDVESLIGRTNNLVIQHSEANNGKVYANVLGILKATVKLPIPADFVRAKDKPAKEGFSKPSTRAVLAPAIAGGVGVDDDIPF